MVFTCNAIINCTKVFIEKSESQISSFLMLLQNPPKHKAGNIYKYVRRLCFNFFNYKVMIGGYAG